MKWLHLQVEYPARRQRWRAPPRGARRGAARSRPGGSIETRRETRAACWSAHQRPAPRAQQGPAAGAHRTAAPGPALPATRSLGCRAVPVAEVGTAARRKAARAAATAARRRRGAAPEGIHRRLAGLEARVRRAVRASPVHPAAVAQARIPAVGPHIPAVAPRTPAVGPHIPAVGPRTPAVAPRTETPEALHKLEAALRTERVRPLARQTVPAGRRHTRLARLVRRAPKRRRCRWQNSSHRGRADDLPNNSFDPGQSHGPARTAQRPATVPAHQSRRRREALPVVDRTDSHCRRRRTAAQEEAGAAHQTGIRREEAGAARQKARAPRRVTVPAEAHRTATEAEAVHRRAAHHYHHHGRARAAQAAPRSRERSRTSCRTCR